MKIHFSASSHEEATLRLDALTRLYGQADIETADYIVPLGGDGHMLHVLHDTMDCGLPVFGMNCGRLGFLMNHYASAELPERLAAAESAPLHPLRMTAVGIDGVTSDALAINEVSLIRQTHNAAHIGITVDDKHQLEQLVCDGVLLATPAGSTAYNLSAHGPILPIEASLLALTPISAFRPRRWRGALLPERADVKIEALEAEKRPISAVADHAEFRNIAEVQIKQDKSHQLLMLFDADHSLDERILTEQFTP